MCEHRIKVRAVNVSVAIAPDGALAGADRQKFFHMVGPQQYALVEYCGNRACEKVFRAEK